MDWKIGGNVNNNYYYLECWYLNATNNEQETGHTYICTIVHICIHCTMYKCTLHIYTYIYCIYYLLLELEKCYTVKICLLLYKQKKM